MNLNNLYLRKLEALSDTAGDPGDLFQTVVDTDPVTGLRTAVRVVPTGNGVGTAQLHVSFDSVDITDTVTLLRSASEGGRGVATVMQVEKLHWDESGERTVKIVGFDHFDLSATADGNCSGPEETTEIVLSEITSYHILTKNPFIF